MPSHHQHKPGRAGDPMLPQKPRAPERTVQNKLTRFAGDFSEAHLPCAGSFRPTSTQGSRFHAGHLHSKQGLRWAGQSRFRLLRASHVCATGECQGAQVTPGRKPGERAGPKVERGGRDSPYWQQGPWKPDGQWHTFDDPSAQLPPLKHTP